jgi:hypothetical protein
MRNSSHLVYITSQENARTWLGGRDVVPDGVFH